MTRTGTALAAGCCLVAFLAAALLPSLGPADPVAMPTTPAWLTAVAAAAAAVLVLVTSRARVRITGIVATGACAAVMAAGSLLALPHTILMVVVWAANLITGAGGSFEVAPSWSATLMHLAVLAALVAVTAWIVARVRLLRGSCPRCGRRVPQPPTVSGRRSCLVWLAAVSVFATVPYAGLKLAWSAGMPLGLVDGSFAEATFASPGFGDTVIMSAVSIIVSVVMGLGVRQKVVRLVSAGVGAVAALMLIPVGGSAAIMLVASTVGAYTIDDSAIAPWAYIVVYLSFLTWGTAMVLLVWNYWRATARTCRRHTVPPPAPAARRSTDAKFRAISSESTR